MVNQLPVIGVSVWFIVKIFFLIAIGVYDLFAIVVVRQVQLMTDTLEVGFETPIRLLSLLHLLVAIGVFILALFTL